MNDIRDQTFLSRLFGHFGYEKRRHTQPFGPQAQHAVIAKPPRPTHRIAQARFDYARANLNSMWFSYRDEGDRFSYAIGKDDWLPIAIAAMMLGDTQKDALKLIANYSRHAMWLDPESAEFSAWIKANDTVFDRIAALQCDPSVGTVEKQNRRWPDKFGLLQPIEVSYQYRLFWRRMHVDMSEDFLAITEAHAEFCRLPEVNSVTVGLAALGENLTGLVECWFESRGCTVDKDLHLVNVPGYEALFYSAEQGY